MACAVVERRKLAFAGCAFVAIAVSDKGELADDPEVDLIGIPEAEAEAALHQIVTEAESFFGKSVEGA